MQQAHYISETEQKAQKALIVAEHKDNFVISLKKELERFDMDVYISSSLFNRALFDIRFVVCSKQLPLPKKDSHKTVYILFIKNRKEYRHFRAESKQKIIYIIGDRQYAISQMEKILWFAVNKNEEAKHLTLESMLQPRQGKKTIPPLHNKRKYSFSLKRAIILSILCIFMALVAFFIPLGITTYYSYKTVKKLAAHAFQDAATTSKKQRRIRTVSELLYSPVRPFYLFFSIARFPDDVFLMNTTIEDVCSKSTSLLADGTLLAELIVKPNKSDADLEQTRSLFKKTVTALLEIEDKMLLLNQKIPARFLSKENAATFQSIIVQIQKSKKAIALVPELLGDPTEKKILILFANNMELRPGGGFIGSFGILRTKKFGIENLEIYDVYDADGQLTAHVDPPTPIRQYLGQPHWFLRDSAFFPDFYDTYQQAAFFLQKEMNLSSWDGCFLFTTSAVKDIVGSFGTINLPDYNEKITKDNFYVKTQFYAENNFFPGSTQKKSFLSSIVKQVFLELHNVDPTLFGSATIQAFDQKNIVAYFENAELQKKIDDLYWNGRTMTPFCPANISSNCYADYQYALDANLGINKANFFVDRTYTTHTSISEQGLVLTTVEIYYKNNSLSAVFPGGTYNNYFQILLPASSLVQEVSVDNVQITQYDSQTGKHKQIGFMVAIPPQREKTIRITYQSSTVLKSGRAVYQLVIQKQIGGQQNDLSFSLELPKNVSLVNQNFSPLVKQGQIIYNTDLSTDRVFYIELLKE